LQTTGEYEDALEKKAIRPGASITFSASLWKGSGKPLLKMEIRDNGPGLPVSALHAGSDSTSVNGRGLKMISRFNDSVFIGSPGGYMIILKTIEGGDGHADRT
jgi:anti-sigma regulatory factor (Ser/Thr protein kinase)